VLDLLHLFDKMGFTWRLSERDVEGNPPSTEPNAQPDELAAKVARKPKQNEKIAHATKPRAKPEARKNGVPKPHKAARKRVSRDDGWIPGGG
jgi:hypothetical protein